MEIKILSIHQAIGISDFGYMTLKLNKTISELPKSASRALSALYTKSLKAGGMTIDVFEKLYESLVKPVLFYASRSWGMSDYRVIEKYKLSKIKRVDISLAEKNARQMWPYEMIWAGIRVMLNQKLKYSECGLNKRNVSDDRLLKTVHYWSKRNTRGWEARVLKLSNNLNVTNVINDQNLPMRVALDNVKLHLRNKDVEKWTQSLNESDKLRTYRTYKCNLEREWYCYLPLSRDHRRVLLACCLGSKPYIRSI